MGIADLKSLGSASKKDLESLVIGEFGTGFVTDEMMDNTEGSIKGLVASTVSSLADILHLTTVAPITNTYTLDLDNQPIKNFKITSADANAKTIALSNVDATKSLITISVLIICTTAAAFTHPTGVTFTGGIPTFTTGQSYWVSYDSIDGGVTWAGYSVRRT